MTLQSWVEYGWLRPHKTSRAEVSELMAIVDRDLESARLEQLTPDWRFGIAYNAALKLCTILLYASGYRAGRDLAHKRTVDSLPLILGEGRKADARYLDKCRIKRHAVEYETAGTATEKDADELIGVAFALRTDVLGWLGQNHPELL
jgi:hypothetical protein